MAELADPLGDGSHVSSMRTPATLVRSPPLVHPQVVRAAHLSVTELQGSEDSGAQPGRIHPIRRTHLHIDTGVFTLTL
jgi:hypothetical protein